MSDPDVLELEGGDCLRIVPLFSYARGTAWRGGQVPVLSFDLLSWWGGEGKKKPTNFTLE